MPVANLHNLYIEIILYVASVWSKTLANLAKDHKFFPPTFLKANYCN